MGTIHKRLNIVDFQYLYYKYFNTLKIGRLRRLSNNGKDTTMAYYTIKEIEGFSEGGKIPTCVCFDSKAKKRAESEEYKKNRKSTLGDENYAEIDEIRQLLSNVGYEVYKEDGYEADDLVASLTKDSLEEYDEIHIYTIDKDLLQLVNEKVKVHLYRTGVGYVVITMDNFETESYKLFKTMVPYNMVKLFKCTVGDSSDNIKGINKFGPSAFQKLIQSSKADLSRINDFDYIQEYLKNNLTDDKAEQAIESLKLVEFLDVTLRTPFKDGFFGNRDVYKEYGFNSFIK